MSDQPRIRVTITETVVYKRDYTPAEIVEVDPDEAQRMCSLVLNESAHSRAVSL